MPIARAGAGAGGGETPYRRQLAGRALLASCFADAKITLEECRRDRVARLDTPSARTSFRSACCISFRRDGQTRQPQLVEERARYAKLPAVQRMKELETFASAELSCASSAELTTRKLENLTISNQLQPQAGRQFRRQKAPEQTDDDPGKTGAYRW